MWLRGLALLALVVVGAAAARAEDEPPRPRLTRAPALVQFVEPVYPEEARASGQTATVTLSLALDATGHVTGASVVGEPQPGFDEAALAAGARLLFTPAEIDGKPSPVRITYRFHFKLTAPPPPTIGRLRGVVRERASGTPIGGVTVEIRAPAELAGRNARTDETGRFELAELPPAVYLLHFFGPGLVGTLVEQPVRAGDSAEAAYQLDRATRRRDVDEELVFRVPRRRELGTELSTAEARSVPGVLGDSIAVVQNLPGVARASAGSGDVVVWGSSPAETRTYVDDVPVPSLYHRGGLRAVINDALVSSVELVPGGFGPQYGRATGGLVRLQTNVPPRPGLHGIVAADLIDASAALTLRPRAGRSTFSVAGRYSYLDRLLFAVSDRIQQVVPVPSYWDYSGLYTYTGESSQTQVLLFGAGDRVVRQVPSPGATELRAERTDSDFHRLALRHVRGRGDTQIATTLWLGLDRSAYRADFGPLPTELASTTVRYGLRASWLRRVHRVLSLELGVDVEGSHAELRRTGTLSLPAREGDIVVFGQPPGDRVASDRWTVNLMGFAAYAQAELRLFRGRLRISPGLRVEPQVLEGDRLLPASAGSVPVGYARLTAPADPRLRIDLAASSRVALHGAIGLYHQPPDPADLSPVFGSTTLGNVQALQVLAGGAVKITSGTTVELDAFYKRGSGLATRSPSDSPAIAQALVDTGEARSYGGQVLLRQRPWHGLSGWLSYSILRAERRTNADSRWRPFDLEQNHVLVAVATYAHRGWEAGARLRVSTGYPRTPVVGAYTDARTGVAQPVFGLQNSERLPTFVQLDLHGQRTWTLRGVLLTVYLDVLNVTDRANPEEVVYGYDYRQKGFLTGLPILGVAGLRVEF